AAHLVGPATRPLAATPTIEGNGRWRGAVHGPADHRRTVVDAGPGTARRARRTGVPATAVGRALARHRDTSVARRHPGHVMRAKGVGPRPAPGILHDVLVALCGLATAIGRAKARPMDSA